MAIALGEHLVQEGLLKSDQLKQIETEVKRTREPFHKILRRFRFIEDKQLNSFLSAKFNIPEVEISHQVIKPEVLKLIPESMIRKFSLLPLRKIGKRLTVVMSDPFNLNQIDQIRLKTGFEVEPAIATESEIRSAIEQYYGVKSEISGVLEDLEKSADKVEHVKGEERTIQETPVIKLVNMMMTEAVREGVSDIHIAPDKDEVKVRYRIDGLLHEADRYPKELHSAVVSRIKVISNLDIAENRVPQDGRIRMDIENQTVDTRISIMPTVHGENVVIRLLNLQNALISLEQLGMPSANLVQFRKSIQKPYGIVLITGPTGSGKTTTLYAAMNQINSPEKHIITIEDPVEYQLPLIRQIQVNPGVNLTFANGLRSILRQDPDIIMVGEIRDKETAEIAIQAALTGHLVFSTLHTNNASSAVTRLLEMGIQPFLIASTVICVVAQRLVRMICKDCSAPFSPTEQDLQNLSLISSSSLKNPPTQLYRGKGCLNCKRTGFRKRSGIFEMLIPDQSIRDLVMAHSTSDEVERKAIEKGMVTLRQDGLDKIKSGVTTIEEVLRATQEVS